MDHGNFAALSAEVHGHCLFNDGLDHSILPLEGRDLESTDTSNCVQLADDVAVGGASENLHFRSILGNCASKSS